MNSDREGPASQELALKVARLLRHEVGDFLQGVFSLVAVFRTRLTAEQQVEQRLVGDFRRWAERVRAVLDGTVQLLSSSVPVAGWPRFDLVPLIEASIAATKRAHAELPITLEAESSALVCCDRVGLADAMSLLFAGLAQGARSLNVTVVAEEGVRCQISREGIPPTTEQLKWMESPFTTTQQGVLGLALGLCARLARLAGGSMEAHVEEGSLTVRLGLPEATLETEEAPPDQLPSGPQG